MFLFARNLQFSLQGPLVIKNGYSAHPLSLTSQVFHGKIFITLFLSLGANVVKWSNSSKTMFEHGWRRGARIVSENRKGKLQYMAPPPLLSLLNWT